MKSIAARSLFCSLVFFLCFSGATLATARAEETRLLRVREGLHNGFSRLVLDCVGERPIRMQTEPDGKFTVQYKQLTVEPDLGAVSRRLQYDVEQVEYDAGPTGRVTLKFKSPDVRIKSFILRKGKPEEKIFMVVMDIFPRPPRAAAGRAPTPAIVAPPPPPVPAAAPTAPPIAKPKAAPVAKPPASEASTAAAAAPSAEPETTEEETASGSEGPVYSGEISIIARSADGEEESAEFEKYRDISQAVYGEAAISAEWNRRYYAEGRATGVGQNDRYAAIEGGEYGKYRLELSYDQFIKRYPFDMRTLYSGVGSPQMTLDDNLQSFVQQANDAADFEEVATRLQSFLPSAAVGDPEVTRDKIKVGAGLVATDPFHLEVEITHEKREGTRPFAGAFSDTQMVELFEPIDYETIGMKVAAEYARNPVYLNLTYQYSQFKNNNDTLFFDNPLRNVDIAGESSSGLIDLAPDNAFHNFSFTGALNKLPGNSQLTAVAALGMMTQDDDLVPFTTNTAIAAPALPAESADAKVNTLLYQLRLTSKPLPYLRVKGRVRYYDYSNETDRIDFSNGYVETDATLVSTAITNLPTSYTKTLASLDLGFDVLTRTSLGIGYTFERTERENREVKDQNDNTYRASVDSRPTGWLDLHAGYERTNRAIDDYNFNVYLQSGDDLRQLPQLRKYDESDLVRDRLQLQATVYPLDALSIGASLILGRDDFEDSPYGLQEDNHSIIALDADYAINERASVNLFYSMETYDNTQRGRENGFGNDFDWTAEGEDVVTTVGGGGTVAILPDRLDFKASYTHSDVDGNISISSPATAFADFSVVDDSVRDVLEAKLTYHFNPRLSLALGYLHEIFDYEDDQSNGFSNVPTDDAGNYQGALLSGALPKDYDARIIYTQLTFRLP